MASGDMRAAVITEVHDLANLGRDIEVDPSLSNNLGILSSISAELQLLHNPGLPMMAAFFLSNRPKR
jgi:4'-phosphopantetheinyl transferase EntD